MDASVDLYGGGGLMSTCGDLARFFRGLVQGRVFRSPETLATMTTTLRGIPRAESTPLEGRSREAAMYLFRAHIGGRDLVGSRRLLGHDGVHVPRGPDSRLSPATSSPDMPEEFDRKSSCSPM